MREELVRALWEIGSRYYSGVDAVNDGSAAFEISLSSAGVTTNGEYYIPRLGVNSSFGAPSLPLRQSLRYLIWLFFPGGPLSICLTMRL